MKNEILLFPYGGQFKWVHLALREFSAVRYVLIFANDEKMDRVGNSTLTYFEKAVIESTNLKEQEVQQGIPKSMQIQIKVLKIPSYQQFAQYFGFFRSLFIQLIPFLKSNNKYKNYCNKEIKLSNFQRFFEETKIGNIHIHLDSGLMMYRLALYQCAHEFRDLSIHLFIYNKISNLSETIPIHQGRNSIENRVIEILKNQDKISVSELLEEYTIKFEEKSLSYMLKIVNRLIEMGYVESKKVGREKQISLTQFSSSAFLAGKYSNTIKENLLEL